MTNQTNPGQPSRRQFIQTAGAASALAAFSLPQVYAGEGKNTLQVALVGCGGRGTGAAANALSVTNADTKLVAMADVFSHRLERSYKAISNNSRESPAKSQCRRKISSSGLTPTKKRWTA